MSDAHENAVPATLLVSPFVVDVAAELARSQALHSPIRSAHHAYGLILEEVDEFWDEVKKKAENRDPRNMRLELVQIAAAAWKAALNLGLEGPLHTQME